MLLLPLHASILEPDLDLSLTETESVSDFDPPPTGQVAVEVELLFQLQGLISRVSLSAAFPFCWQKIDGNSLEVSDACVQKCMGQSRRRDGNKRKRCRMHAKQ